MSSLDLVQEAIKTLEDDGHTNAGYGSNLTLDGTVECDAALMHAESLSNINGFSSRSSFGSVGAVSS